MCTQMQSSGFSLDVFKSLNLYNENTTEWVFLKHLIQSWISVHPFIFLKLFVYNFAVEFQNY